MQCVDVISTHVPQVRDTVVILLPKEPGVLLVYSATKAHMVYQTSAAWQADLAADLADSTYQAATVAGSDVR
jgi:hypothetical protein